MSFCGLYYVKVLCYPKSDSEHYSAAETILQASVADDPVVDRLHCVAERIFDVAVEECVAPVACRVVVVIIHDRRLKAQPLAWPYRE